MPDRVKIRPAVPADLERLKSLEEKGFSGDRFRPAQIRYLLTRAKASIFMAESDGTSVGMAIMLWRKKQAHGRLYDIVVDPLMQGRGIGRLLLDRCLEEARKRNCRTVSLEVRADNKGAIKLYERNDFRRDRELPDYYSDGSPAIKMVRGMNRDGIDTVRRKVPFYPQTLEFTCGPACLMMAMKYFDPQFALNRIIELNIWKESTLIFMTSGIGGTGPFGLAYSAQIRGFQTELFLSRDHNPFYSTVKKDYKKQVIRLISRDLRERAEKEGTHITYGNCTTENMMEAIAGGYIPIILISTYRIHGDRSPHWVVMTGFDSKYIYFHDPYIAAYDRKRGDARDVKMPIDEFRKIRKYGSKRFKSVLMIKGKKPTEITKAMKAESPKGV